MKTIEIVRELSAYVMFGSTCYGVYSINQEYKEVKNNISNIFSYPKRKTENATNTIKSVGYWGYEKWNNNVPAMSSVTYYLPSMESITNNAKNIGYWGYEKWNNNVPAMSSVTYYLPSMESITNNAKNIGYWGYEKWNNNVPAMSSVTYYLPSMESITNNAKNIGYWGYEKWNNNVPAMSSVTYYLPSMESITNNAKNIGYWCLHLRGYLGKNKIIIPVRYFWQSIFTDKLYIQGYEKWNNNVPAMSSVTYYLPSMESITNNAKNIGYWGYKKWNKDVPESKDE